MCPHTTGDTITARRDDQIFAQGLCAYKAHESIPLLTNWPSPSGWYDDASACPSAISTEVCRLNKGPKFKEDLDDEYNILYKSEDDYTFVTEFPLLLGSISSLSERDSAKEDTLPLSSLFKATEALDIEDKVPLSQLFQCHMMQARHSTTDTNTHSLSILHTSLLEKEAHLTSTGEVHFTLIKKEDLYMVSSAQSRLLCSIKQNEVSIGF
ncbi:hypothetical protein MRB53_035065 [Persea americana]|uniref:Uncharacterized protein n=1 Tax=Persea americana TaxID=3435 RepID=A0ACC2K3V2_PERAE|nr:hypothetical protein MRB53_035065 [Persea americana]